MANPLGRRRRRADELADELEQMILDLERVQAQLIQELRHDDGTAAPAC